MNTESERCGCWSNDETATMYQWMMSDPINARSWYESARSLYYDEKPSDFRHWCAMLAREIRDEAEAYCCSWSGDLAADLLELSLQRVNWTQLAEALFAYLGVTANEQERGPSDTDQKSSVQDPTFNPFTGHPDELAKDS